MFEFFNNAKSSDANAQYVPNFIRYADEVRHAGEVCSGGQFYWTDVPSDQSLSDLMTESLMPDEGLPNISTPQPPSPQKQAAAGLSSSYKVDELHTLFVDTVQKKQTTYEQSTKKLTGNIGKPGKRSTEAEKPRQKGFAEGFLTFSLAG